MPKSTQKQKLSGKELDQYIHNVMHGLHPNDIHDVAATCSPAYMDGLHSAWYDLNSGYVTENPYNLDSKEFIEWQSGYDSMV